MGTKKLLRNRANFEILEGFLSVLLNEDMLIKTILESESTSQTEVQKMNRVDLLVENSRAELIIIELQYSSEFDYRNDGPFQRTLLLPRNSLSSIWSRAWPTSRYEKCIQLI